MQLKSMSEKWLCLLILVGITASQPAYAVGGLANKSVNVLLVVSIYIAFCGWIFLSHKRRALQTKNDEQDKSEAFSNLLQNNPQDDNHFLVAYASQTGNAEQLAQKTAESLRSVGLSVTVLMLSKVNLLLLQRFKRVLWVVSTTGEGDAPNNAIDFLSTVMQNNVQLNQVQYAILALGDSSYAHFCGFGHALNNWLQNAHAQPLFDLITVDHGDDGALRHWQYQLGILAKNTEMADWQAPNYQTWVLNSRTLLNKGSVGAPVYHLKLSSSITNMRWQAGDIAEVGPQNSPETVTHWLNQLGLNGAAPVNKDGLTFAEALQNKILPPVQTSLETLARMQPDTILQTLKNLPHREYSIASIPQDGNLELVIRQMRDANGKLGAGSGWLTEYAAVRSVIALRIRKNTAFHAQHIAVANHRGASNNESASRKQKAYLHASGRHAPMILIGNGTGIAGLRAHLKARVAAAIGNNWLIFGERQAKHDFYFKNELVSWQNQGLLTKLDTAFSRDEAERFYVQDMIKQASEELKNWVTEGAAIYVCGSANGMAPAVHQALLHALGEATLNALTTSGRYRRDVY